MKPIKYVSNIPAVIVFVLIFGAVASAQKITANPNPVFLSKGQTHGTTTLTWEAGNEHPYAEIWVKVDGADETFVVESGKGTRAVYIERGKTYIFKLSDGNELIASVIVTTKERPPEDFKVGIAQRVENVPPIRMDSGADKSGKVDKLKAVRVTKADDVGNALFIRDVKLDDFTQRSFTLSFTTMKPARVDVRAGVLSSMFGLPGYTMAVLEGAKTSDWKKAHRLTIRVRGWGIGSGNPLPPGRTLRLFIHAHTQENRHFDYEQNFTTPK
jgi:hypothetical protein